MSSNNSDVFELCESTLSNYHRSGLLAGAALVVLRDLGEFGTFQDFETYCKSRWDIGKSHAYNLLGASSVYSDLSGLSPLQFLQASSISPIGEKFTPPVVEEIFPPLVEKPFPQNERQCRPLVPLTADDRRRCWSRVLELHATGRRLSQSLVQQAVDELTGPSVTGNLSTDNPYSKLNPEYVRQHTPRPYILPHLSGGHYFTAYNSVFDVVSPRLKDHTAAYVYISLLRVSVNGFCRITPAALAEKCSLVEKTLNHKLKKLHAHGFFSTFEEKKQIVYRLHDLAWVLDANGWVPSPVEAPKKQKS